jgi:hypothetical protein
MLFLKRINDIRNFAYGCPLKAGRFVQTACNRVHPEEVRAG